MADKIRVGIVGATVDKFGAELAFWNFEHMLARPDIDLVVVCVRVPGHHDLVMQALEAGKAVFCEWPLGANVAEAEKMADLASRASLPSAVGLQARSDPALMYARELVEQGYVGEVLGARMTGIGEARPDRGSGRIWQGDRRNGANTLTIAGGHAIDALCFVLGEPTEVSARLATTITEWHNTDTGGTLQVDSPDWISVSGRLERGAEFDFHVATVPVAPSGNRFEIYGRQGTLIISGGSSNTGPNKLQGAQGSEALAAMEPPERFKLAPSETPAGPPRNVAQAYARFASANQNGDRYQPDFAHAVKRHKLIEAIERSSAEGRMVQLTT